MERKKIAVFAAGEYAQEFIQKDHEYDIVAVFDNDPNKWGKLFCGFIVLNPKSILDIEFDYLVVATVYQKQISADLVKKYPDLESKICTLRKIDGLEHVLRQYNRRYDKKCHKKYSLMNKKIVVYSGIFGKYDDLHELLYKDEGVDYICYTDDKTLTSDTWDIKYVECEQNNMALEVRKYKCLPHRYLSEYDVSMWIDAQFQIKSSVIKYIQTNMQDTGLLFLPHEQRDCIYEEGAANIMLHKENPWKIISQLYKYSVEGYPEHNGLYYGGCIVREHNRVEIIKIMEEWYNEILHTSARDQISLPYVLWKNKVLPDLCREYCWDNDLYKYYPHNV